MSCYVTNFESLLLKEFPSNGMTQPLKTMIGVANFSVNFPLQRKKGRNLLRPFGIFIYSKNTYDAFGVNGALFTDHHRAGFKSCDVSGVEITQGAGCCDSEGFEDDPDEDTQHRRFEDEIADGFEDDVVLSAADRFRCFIHAVYDIIIAPSYRIPKTVKKIRVYPDNCFFGVCPRCNKSIDREYQDFCNCCGQRLDWSMLDEAEEE